MVLKVAIPGILLANGMYNICWMCALCFILEVLLYDVLKIKANLEYNNIMVIIVVLTVGVLLLFWQVFGIRLSILQVYDCIKAIN